MSALWVVAYFAVGLLAFGVFVASAVARGESAWDSPVPIFSILLWPILVPTVGIYTLAVLVGKKAKQRRRLAEFELREQERLLREAGL